MLFTEFNMEDALEIRGEEKFAEGVSVGREDGIAVGRADGIAIGRADGIAAGRVDGEKRFALLV